MFREAIELAGSGIDELEFATSLARPAIRKLGCRRPNGQIRPRPATSPTTSQRRSRADRRATMTAQPARVLAAGGRSLNESPQSSQAIAIGHDVATHRVGCRCTARLRKQTATARAD